MKNSARSTMLAPCLLAVGLCGGLAWTGRAQAATYVVNPSHPAASDQGEGSEAKPFKTLEHAVQAAQAGDTVLVMPGSYGRITIGKRGTKERPIIIKGSAVPSQSHVDKKKLLDPAKPTALPGNPVANAVTKGFVLEGIGLSGWRTSRSRPWTRASGGFYSRTRTASRSSATSCTT